MEFEIENGSMLETVHLIPLHLSLCSSQQIVTMGSCFVVLNNQTLQMATVLGKEYQVLDTKGFENS